MARKSLASIVGVVLATALSPHTGLGQRVQFPTSPILPAAQAQTQPFGQTQPLGQTQPQFQPGPGLQPIPGVMLGQPTFDPYSNNPTAPVAPPALLGPPQGLAPPAAMTQPSLGQPTYIQPNLQPATLGQPTLGQPTFGQPPVLAAPGLQGYPQQPPVLFPEGLSPQQAYPQPYTQGWGPAGMFGQAEPGPYLRLFQDVRLQHTWINGESGADVEIHDTQVSTTVNFPNFLFSQQPIHITPTFILHLWDGPSHSAFDLPPRAYSAFVDFGWAPQATPQLGAELNVSVGVYTDFEHINEDSIRVRGVGLGVYHLTPRLTLKAGVEYLDRVDIKLLPAGGLFWRPNPHTNFEIYFPRPKLSQWLTTLGNTDLWWYVGGEYGGGSWTIERTSGLNDRIDINDFRAFLGVEWGSPPLIREGRPSGFFEAGYVFEREVVYVSGGGFSPPDTFMLRGGLAF